MSIARWVIFWSVCTIGYLAAALLLATWIG